jgi:hypothetical protein
MDRTQATTQIREAARTVVQALMKMHPAIPHLDDPETQNDCFKHLHQLTTELEAIKKKLAKLESRDTSADL